MKKEKRNVLYYHSTRPEMANLSRKQIILGGRTAVTEAVYGSKEQFTVVCAAETLRCIGPKIFWQTYSKDMLTFKGGKFYGALNNTTINTMIKVFGLNWIDTFCRILLRTDKRLWLLIIQGKITNPEQLAKRFSRLYFKGVFSYRSLKLFYTLRLGCEITLNDIYYYSTNPNVFVEKLSELAEDDYRLIADVIKYCRIENTRINPLWSKKRMEQEHQMQIDRDLAEELTQYSDEAIAPPFTRDGLSLILSERDAAKESILMHNCVHRCYWPKIKKGEYAVVKGCIGGKPFDMGMYISRRGKDTFGITFDQIHTRYNYDVSWETRDWCRQWLDNWASEILTVYKDIYYSVNAKEKIENIDDVPF